MSNQKLSEPTKHLLSLVRVTLAIAISHFSSSEEWQDKTGGYFCQFDPAEDTVLVLEVVGNLTLDSPEATKYRCFAEEKARRLAKYPDHVSSWQSRDPSAECWGGAVRIGSYIFSFSGIPELGDEALMLAAACLWSKGVVNRDFEKSCDEIAIISKNPYWRALKALSY